MSESCRARASELGKQKNEEMSKPPNGLAGCVLKTDAFQGEGAK